MLVNVLCGLHSDYSSETMSSFKFNLICDQSAGSPLVTTTESPKYWFLETIRAGPLFDAKCQNRLDFSCSNHVKCQIKPTFFVWEEESYYGWHLIKAQSRESKVWIGLDPAPHCPTYRLINVNLRVFVVLYLYLKLEVDYKIRSSMHRTTN